MNFCGIELGTTQLAALASFVFAIASELIGRSKLKENSVIDVAMTLAKTRVLRSITSGAHTPLRELQTTPRPRVSNPAPKKRGRPAKKAPSSKT